MRTGPLLVEGQKVAQARYRRVAECTAVAGGGWRGAAAIGPHISVNRKRVDYARNGNYYQRQEGARKQQGYKAFHCGTPPRWRDFARLGREGHAGSGKVQKTEQGERWRRWS